MIKTTLQNLLLFGFIIVLIHGITRSAASIPSGESFLGVSPEDLSYYKGLSSSISTAINCKDGSKIFNKSQFNDDFCDCPDGSDEPGTSACPTGKFYCKNAGHAPLIVYSSRVNDGICDCCDGSDEHDGKTKCPNTCWEAGNVAREKLRKKISTYQEGVTIRHMDVELAKFSMAKDKGELLKLKDEEKILKGLVEKIKERKELIEKAEKKERLQKEKEEEERKEAEGAKEKETKVVDNEPVQNDIHGIAGKTDQLSQDFAEDRPKPVNEAELIDHSIKGIPPNGEKDNEISLQNKRQPGKDTNFNEKAGLDTGNKNTEHQGNESNFDVKAGLDTENQDENIAEDSGTLSREELGRRVMSRWTGENSEQHEVEYDVSIAKNHALPDETSNASSNDEDNGYGSDDDENKYEDDKHNYDEDNESEDQIDSNSYDGQHKYYDSSSSPKPESDDEFDLSDVTGTSESSWLEKIRKKVRDIFQTVNVFQKPVNISDARQIRKEYDELSTKLTEIQSRISLLTHKLNQDFGPEKEFYSFYGQCFEAKQNKYVYKVCPFKEASQEEGHTTTRLGRWDKFEDSYRTLQFSNGDKCWNGPDRSLKVKLRCGLKNELTDVDEPSRCEYVALLSTPALCLDSRLKELNNKLELLKVDQPGEHDEL